MSFYDSEEYTNIKGLVEKDKNYKTWHTNNTSWYGMCGGGVEERFDVGPCHASLQRFDVGYNFLISGIKTTFGTMGQQQEEYKKIAYAYYDLLLNHSVFSDLFLTHDVERVIEDGFFVIDTNKNRDLIINCCIHSRLAWEYVQQTQKVVKLWQHGVHPMLALYLGQVVVEQNQQIKIAGSTGGHNGVCMHWNRGNLKGFLNGTYKDSPSLKESTRYSGVVNGFGDSAG